MAKNWAICIGINNYNYMQPLKYAMRDADEMYQWLTEKAKFEKVYRFTDNSPSIPDMTGEFSSQPTYTTLLRWMGKRFKKQQKPLLSPGDNLWFFFSGHGWHYKEQDYLLLSDSDPSPEHIKRTAISLDDITERLRQSGAGNVILFIDACRDSAKKGVGLELTNQQGIISIASCSPNELSYEITELQHGSFTYALLESLKIQGEGNCATVERLSNRLRNRVKEINQRYKKPSQTTHEVIQPASKYHLILLPSQATLQDVKALKWEASKAEDEDLELAEKLWTQVLVASPADLDALTRLKKIWLENLKWKYKFQIQELESKQDKSKSLQSQIKQLKEQLAQERSLVEQLQLSERAHKQQLEEKERALQSEIRQLKQKLEQARAQNETDQNEIVRLREKLIERSPTASQAQSFTEDLGKGIKLEMIAIPGGKFMMGEPEGEGEDSEKPQHEVTVQPFFMGKYPITQAQYQKVMSKNPSSFKGDERPVEQVSWDDAVEFCQRLSRQTGKEYRLPSEAEWEYACRAGTTTAYYFGKSITEEQANYRGSGTTAVGKYPPNDFGLYDMHGNVWEWCQDNWHENYKGAPNDGRAWVSGLSNNYVIRGGSWINTPGYCRSAYRDDYTRDDRYHDVGFRVVRVAPRTT